MDTVRTVLGDLPAADLGPTDYHEHLFQASPLLLGDELDNEAASGHEAVLLRESGFATMVDATPLGLGARPQALSRISARSGLNVVAATGAHREVHYPDGHWLRSAAEDKLAARFYHDIEFGMEADDPEDPGQITPGVRVRAGLIKTGIGYWSVSRFERRVLAAAAHTHGRTGVAIMVHLEHGSAGIELLEMLGALGVSPDAVVLAHVDRNPDPVLHAELAAAGCYLGYDGFARTKLWPDSVLVDCFIRAAELGATERLLLGGDVARRTRFVAYGGLPGMGYLGTRVIPRLIRTGHSQLVEAALVANPARLLARFPAPDAAAKEKHD